MWSSTPFPKMSASSGQDSFGLTTLADPDPCVRWRMDIPKWLSVQRQHLLILTHAPGGRRIYPKWLSVQRQHLLILTHASGGKRIYPSDYLHKDNICWSWPMRQVTGGHTQVIVHTSTTSADLDPSVRWQADIPKWLSVQRQHLLILTHASGGRRKYPMWLSIQT